MAHAILSPSAASRWLSCTPSARLEQAFPDASGDAAAEGTLAHELCELYLKKHLKLISEIPYKSALKKVKANAFYSAEMDDHAVDYVEFVTTRFFEREGSKILIEQKIDLTEYVPEGFGTGDAVIIGDGVLEIIDLKYGKGVPVDAHENKQLMLYAVGALAAFRLLYDIESIRVTIHQPRLSNFSSYEISVNELVVWAETEVKPKAKLAFEGEGDLVPGSHCKFCKAKIKCRALAEYNMQVAKHEFKDANLLTNVEISEILKVASDVKSWLTAVQEFALNEAISNNVKWPDFKLVAGKSNRLITDEAKAIAALEKVANKTQYLKPASLLGLTALEKNLGKSGVALALDGLIIKPSGAPTLVPIWDKRPELNSNEAAKDAFIGIDVDGTPELPL